MTISGGQPHGRPGVTAGPGGDERGERLIGLGMGRRDALQNIFAAGNQRSGPPRHAADWIASQATVEGQGSPGSPLGIGGFSQGDQGNRMPNMDVGIIGGRRSGPGVGVGSGLETPWIPGRLGKLSVARCHEYGRPTAGLRKARP